MTTTPHIVCEGKVFLYYAIYVRRRPLAWGIRSRTTGAYEGRIKMRGKRAIFSPEKDHFYFHDDLVDITEFIRSVSREAT